MPRRRENRAPGDIFWRSHLKIYRLCISVIACFETMHGPELLPRAITIWGRRLATSACPDENAVRKSLPRDAPDINRRWFSPHCFLRVKAACSLSSQLGHFGHAELGAAIGHQRHLLRSAQRDVVHGRDGRHRIKAVRQSYLTGARPALTTSGGLTEEKGAASTGRSCTVSI